MPTAIAVTSADLVLPPNDRQTPPAALLRAPDDQSLDDALAETTVLLEQHGHVVVLCPSSLPAAHRMRLHTIRTVLESNRIALLGTDLPPLGLAVLVRQLRQLSICDFGAGVIASAARLLAHYVYAGALLGTVARLDRVPVSLKSHAKSWLPGAQFAVLANPRPQLLRIGAGDERIQGPDFVTQLAVANGQLHSEWVTGTLAHQWQVRGVQETLLPADSPGWWGTPKLIEFAAFLPDVSVLYQLVASVRREVCTWCGIQLIGDRCGFCSATLARHAVREPAAALPAGPHGT
ncbi:hypothetical protein QCN29_33190 [Streptomyces sp. HNM0663]|uniref:Uncharacterized protein n=1 Tax=Streptomyces chengmaiensis TaxID=3040919 RepID=A0ABT6HXX0_9ACTN|nr:hypothetical protein [Streptomyces chengmaiensis]MDH2393537.1 hypothetical protein [Streptomyces chengmaiensis]